MTTTRKAERNHTWYPCSPGCPGWGVFNENGEIQRCDECNRFADDDEAIQHVITAHAKRRKLPQIVCEVRSGDHRSPAAGRRALLAMW